MDQYGDALIRFVQAHVKDHEQAQDIAQETFMRLYQFRRRHPGREITVAWLYTVARRLCIDQHRRDRIRPQSHLDDGIKTLPDPAGDHADPVVEQSQMIAVLDRLPAGERNCLVLFYFQDWSSEQIAAHLNLSPVTVRVRLHRARERFRRLWQEEERDG